MTSRFMTRALASAAAIAVVAGTLVSALAAPSGAAQPLAPTWSIAANGLGAGNVDANHDGVMDPFMSVVQTSTTAADANVATDTVQPWTPGAFAAPTSYTIDVKAMADCTGVTDTFLWSMNGTTDPMQTGCAATFVVPAAGAPITVQDTTTMGTTQQFVAKPKNFWIVSLGDSFASGEGNPQTCIASSLDPSKSTATDCVHAYDNMTQNLTTQTVAVPGANHTYHPITNTYTVDSDSQYRTTPGTKTVTAGTRSVQFAGNRWIWQGGTYDQPCDRSTWAASALSAMSLQQADPHVSIDYLQLACSGAQLGTGLVYPYKGYSQLAKLAQAIKASGRKPSQVVVSAGGNDAQLVGMLFDCLAGDCTAKKSPAQTKLKNDLAGLPYWISSTAKCMTTTKCSWQNAPHGPKAKATGIAGLSLNPKTITVLSYADLTRANPLGVKQPAPNDFVHQHYTNVDVFGKTITPKEAAWAYKNVLGGGLTPLMAKTWTKYGIVWADRSPLWGQHGLGLSPNIITMSSNLLAGPNVAFSGKYGQRWFFVLETGTIPALDPMNNGAPGGLGHPTMGGLFYAYRPVILAAAKKLGIS